MSEPKKEEQPAFTDRLQKAFDEALDLKLKAMEKRFDEMIDTKLKALEIEAEHALRKGLGVEADPVIHQSDLISAIRKASLENSEKTRAPAATEKASPDGNKTVDPIDHIFDSYGVKA